MEVSNKNANGLQGQELQGQELFDAVVGMTGLPAGVISEELEVILQKIGLQPNAMTMDDLRMALTAYLLTCVDSGEPHIQEE